MALYALLQRIGGPQVFAPTGRTRIEVPGLVEAEPDRRRRRDRGVDAALDGPDARFAVEPRSQYLVGERFGYALLLHCGQRWMKALRQLALDLAPSRCDVSRGRAFARDRVGRHLVHPRGDG